MGGNMDIEYLLKDLKRQGWDIQRWLNARFREEGSIILDNTDISGIRTVAGLEFVMSPDIHSATSIYWRYKFDDLLPSDRIIDLGANVGGFAILVSLISNYTVLAVEPVRYEYLVQNIALNNAQVVALHKGLGTGTAKKIKWREQESIVFTSPLSRFIAINGGCDFLKMDVEGAEWDLVPEELEGIRRIEGQLHYPHKDFEHPLIDYLERYYDVEYTSNVPPDDRPRLPMYSPLSLNPIFHAWRK
jgi:FkbM family methyltransferase